MKYLEKAAPKKTSNSDICCVRYERTRFRLSKPHQRRRRKPTTISLLPQRSNRHTERDDRHPWQSSVVRRIHRLGSSEKVRAGLQECASTV